MNYDNIKRLADAKTEEERLEIARQMSLEEKFLAGGVLFDWECDRRKIEIRREFPHFNEEQVLAELRRRLAIERSLEYPAQP